MGNSIRIYSGKSFKFVDPKQNAHILDIFSFEITFDTFNLMKKLYNNRIENGDNVRRSGMGEVKNE